MAFTHWKRRKSQVYLFGWADSTDEWFGITIHPFHFWRRYGGGVFFHHERTSDRVTTKMDTKQGERCIRFVGDAGMPSGRDIYAARWNYMRSTVDTCIPHPASIYTANGPCHMYLCFAKVQVCHPKPKVCFAKPKVGDEGCAFAWLISPFILLNSSLPPSPFIPSSVFLFVLLDKKYPVHERRMKGAYESFYSSGILDE